MTEDVISKCFITVSLLFHYCFITVSSLFHYCFITVSLLFHYCFITADMFGLPLCACVYACLCGVYVCVWFYRRRCGSTLSGHV